MSLARAVEQLIGKQEKVADFYLPAKGWTAAVTPPNQPRAWTKNVDGVDFVLSTADAVATQRTLDHAN